VVALHGIAVARAACVVPGSPLLDFSRNLPERVLTYRCHPSDQDENGCPLFVAALPVGSSLLFDGVGARVGDVGCGC
jgi:hypothetical protein